MTNPNRMQPTNDVTPGWQPPEGRPSPRHKLSVRARALLGIASLVASGVALMGIDSGLRHETFNLPDSVAIGRPISWDTDPERPVLVVSRNEADKTVLFEQCRGDNFPEDPTQRSAKCIEWSIDYTDPAFLGNLYPYDDTPGLIMSQATAGVATPWWHG